MSSITASHLSKAFGRVRAVDDLSFTVEPATITGFLGPNGAGKTTTLRMILGLVHPDTGSAKVGSRRYVELAQPLREVGAVLEATAFHPGRTARTHLLVLCETAGLPAARADEVLDLVELTRFAGRRVGGFSLGMRQRLAIASAMLGEPAVLILDEPANGLDPEGIHWLRAFLRALAQDGRTVLLSSHILAEMDLIADHLVIIAGGKLVRQGPSSEITAGSSLEDVYLDLTRSGGTL